MSSPGRRKRLFDLVGASGGLLLFSPLMVAIAVAIWLDDGGSVFFRQPRLGYRRRQFSILKFRTMRGGVVTRVGRVLRATGLDEVPQFINILAGHMSAVGPRPLTEADVLRLGWTAPEFDTRWDGRPGLTGLAQIVGPRLASDALALDLAYLEEWRPALDCQLIALSFAVNAFGKTRVQRWLRRRTTYNWAMLARLEGWVESWKRVKDMPEDELQDYLMKKCRNGFQMAKKPSRAQRDAWVTIIAEADKGKDDLSPLAQRMIEQVRRRLEEEGYDFELNTDETGGVAYAEVHFRTLTKKDTAPTKPAVTKSASR